MRGIAVLTVILVLSPMVEGAWGLILSSMADDSPDEEPLGLTTYR